MPKEGSTYFLFQVSAPEYILLISDLAGEHRFASIVAKRLESLVRLSDKKKKQGRQIWNRCYEIWRFFTQIVQVFAKNYSNQNFLITF
jgi:hypothetical protein